MRGKLVTRGQAHGGVIAMKAAAFAVRSWQEALIHFVKGELQRHRPTMLPAALQATMQNAVTVLAGAKSTESEKLISSLGVLGLKNAAVQRGGTRVRLCRHYLVPHQD